MKNIFMKNVFINATQCVVCVLDGQGNCVFASTALEAIWTAMYLTGYSDYLTVFREPLSRCRTIFESHIRFKALTENYVSFSD